MTTVGKFGGSSALDNFSKEPDFKETLSNLSVYGYIKAENKLSCNIQTLIIAISLT